MASGLDSMIGARPTLDDKKGNAHSALIRSNGHSWCVLQAILVSNDDSKKRADAAAPNISAVVLLPGVATVKVVILILSASFHLVAVIAPIEVIPPSIVSARVRRLNIAVPTAPLRGDR